jgi:hypothetical protein
MSALEIDLKLKSNKSSDRRQAAKSVGKLVLKELGTVLLDAYINEKRDFRTWETKVEMILSLGLIDYRAALSEIELIVKANLSHDMITYAAAQSYVRLKRKSLHDATPAIELLKSGGLSLVSGALIPLGNDRMTPSSDEIIELVKLSWDLHRRKDRIGNESGYLDPRYGLALACAGWDKKLTTSFLSHCLATYGKDISIKNVAENSLKGKYGKSR